MNPQPLQRNPDMRRTAPGHGTSIPVLGIPVAFETTDPDVLSIIEDAFGAWRVLDQLPQLVADAQVTFRIWVEAGDEGGVRHPEIVRYEPDPDRLVLRTRGSVVIADAARGDATAWLTPALIAERAHVRHRVLEVATIALLRRYDRQPIPAAAISRDRATLVLAGEVGAGKSTLAYLAGRHGYRVLADEAVFIQLRPQLRVWGMPGHIHLQPGARRHFAELGAEEVDAMGGAGVQQVVVSTRAMKALPELPLAPSAGMCIVRRGDRGPSLETIPADALEAELTATMSDGTALEAPAAAAVRAVTRYGGWRLDPGDDPNAALPLLASMFEAMHAE